MDICDFGLGAVNKCSGCSSALGGGARRGGREKYVGYSKLCSDCYPKSSSRSYFTPFCSPPTGSPNFAICFSASPNPRIDYRFESYILFSFMALALQPTNYRLFDCNHIWIIVRTHCVCCGLVTLCYIRIGFCYKVCLALYS
jgi:hypothetical protein